MLKSKSIYYLILVVCLAGAFWLGYAVTQLIRKNASSSMSMEWVAAILAAVLVVVGIIYFSFRHRIGEQQIPCNVQDTQNVKVKNYHFIMATAKTNMGIASVKSADHVNGIAVEPSNIDVQPHRIRIEVRLNRQSDHIVSKDMVINGETAVPVTLPLTERYRLADISSVDIRIRQV
jgi:hypothetical protein